MNSQLALITLIGGGGLPGGPEIGGGPAQPPVHPMPPIQLPPLPPGWVMPPIHLPPSGTLPGNPIFIPDPGWGVGRPPQIGGGPATPPGLHPGGGPITGLPPTIGGGPATPPGLHPGGGPITGLPPTVGGGPVVPPAPPIIWPPLNPGDGIQGPGLLLVLVLGADSGAKWKWVHIPGDSTFPKPTPTPPATTTTIYPANTVTVLASGGSGSVNVTVTPAGPWTVDPASVPAWVTITPMTADMSQNLTYSAAQNTTGIAQQAVIKVNETTFTINQGAV